MIDRAEALTLGLIQGITEFLPVSSSGHLVIAQHLFGLRQPVLLFDIVLHVATLVVVVWFFRRDVGAIARESLEGLRALARGEARGEVLSRFPGFQQAAMIVLGTIPTAIIGIVFESSFERIFASLRTVGLMLCVTGLVLFSTRFARQRAVRPEYLRPVDALLIGFVQGLAITPGISRSGITIGCALLLGIEREAAARYSFLLSIPSIIGALLLQGNGAGGGIELSATALGFASAAIVGYASLVLLVRVVARGRLVWFAPYCLVLGFFVMAFAAGI